MAKRKRLVMPAYPLSPEGLSEAADLSQAQATGEANPLPHPGLMSRRTHPGPPIAQVAADASAQAAIGELSQTLRRARAEGRVVQSLPLERIDQSYLVRDRIQLDRAELDSLIASLRDHGQRSPIEVTELPDGRFGLISGWRRLQALQHLAEEDGGERFGTVLALLRRPATAALAYVAMVEENEIRQGLSYYERARIAARAVDIGVFETEKQALQSLFATASRARRSKIGSFLSIYRSLDPGLRFPAALPERLGLKLAQALEDKSKDLLEALTQNPANSASEEQALLERTLARTPPGTRAQTARPEAANRELAAGIFLTTSTKAGQMTLSLSGPKVDAALLERISRLLASL
jgi:ParB family transcriptional regulator, chromosome partitioning protein